MYKIKIQFGFNLDVINEPEVSIKGFIKSSFKTRYNILLTEDTSDILLSVSVAIFTIGGMIGSLTAGLVAIRFGPKSSLLYTQAISICAAISMGCCEVANSYELLLIGRFLAGISVGLFSGLVPLYITEVSPISIRGSLGVLTQIANTFGILVSMVLGLDNILGDDGLWPLLFALIAVPAIIQIILLPFVPESPKYLILTREDFEGGQEALAKLRGRSVDEVKDEANAIYREARSMDDEDHLSVIGLLSTRSLYLPLFLAVCIHMSQKISGMVAIYYYSTSFFLSAGIASANAQYATIGIGATVLFTTIISAFLGPKL